MLQEQQAHLEALAETDPRLSSLLFSAIAAALPATDFASRKKTSLRQHGHWIYPMILLADWLRRDLTSEQASAESAQLRADYAAAMEYLHQAANAERTYQLTGKRAKSTASSTTAQRAERRAERDANTARLLASLKL